MINTELFGSICTLIISTYISIKHCRGNLGNSEHLVIPDSLSFYQGVKNNYFITGVVSLLFYQLLL